jgi:hypothetical protein
MTPGPERRMVCLWRFMLRRLEKSNEPSFEHAIRSATHGMGGVGGRWADERRSGARIARDKQFIEHLLGIDPVVEDCCEIVAHEMTPTRIR